MRLLDAFSATFIGRALLATFFDLPRWTLANLAFTIALLPAYQAMLNDRWLAAAWATLPVVPVAAGMINMASGQAAGRALRLRDAWACRPTLFTVFIVWASAAFTITLLFAGAPLAVVLATSIGLLFLLVIGVFAIYLPAQLNVGGLLIWRNALVLAASYPVVGLGLLALGVVGLWLVVISKGALIIVVPALWTVLAAFTVSDQIKALQAKHAG